jgi:hypothetical protein
VVGGGSRVENGEWSVKNRGHSVEGGEWRGGWRLEGGGWRVEMVDVGR